MTDQRRQEDDQRFERLPKWAQREIRRLKANLASAEKNLVAVQDRDTNVWIQGVENVPLPPDSTIRFDISDRVYIAVGHQEGYDGLPRLHVYVSGLGGARLAFEPISANVGSLLAADLRLHKGSHA